MNSWCVLRHFNSKAVVIADRNNLPQTGSLDAHFPFVIGRAYAMYQLPLKQALNQGAVTINDHAGYLTGHVVTKIHQVRKRRF